MCGTESHNFYGKKLSSGSSSVNQSHTGTFAGQTPFKISNQKINYLKRECNRVNSFTSDLQLINVFVNVRNRQVVTNEEDLVRSNEIV